MLENHIDQKSGDQIKFSGNLTAPPWSCFGAFIQYACGTKSLWFMLQSNQVREVDSKLLIALVSQLTLLRAIGEITLILLSQCAGSKGI